MSTKLSIDIGGTFTDVVLLHEGAWTTTKVLTTYTDPALGVLQGIDKVLAEAEVTPAAVDLVLHGTTLATNALIERRGANTGLLTTQGHRDVLEMAFENRFEQYDVNIERPEPLVPRWWRLGVPERIDATGKVILDLDESAVNDAIDQLLASGVSAIAVGLLHSYQNPAHELRIAELIRQRAPDVKVSLSSDVCPEIREYERFSTTVANAYVQPLMSTYLASLAAQMRTKGIDAQVLLMTSGGGLTDLQTASKYPIRLVESGPAGGAMLASKVAQTHAEDHVLSFDMGGTTAKICLIDNGEPQHSRSFEVDRRYRFKKGSGLPVRIPVIEMVEIGAGGGSLAHVDELKRIQVGPASAGSEPGPMCYGRGGQQVAVTDANLCVGRIRADGFAGGDIALDPEASTQGLIDQIGAQLDLTAPQPDSDADKRDQVAALAAHSVITIVEENMAAAARSHASEWGKSLQDRTMVAFGGAAPMHAATLAQRLKIKRVVVPAGAGVGSAIGFLLAPVKFEVVRSYVSPLSALDLDRLHVLLDEMRAEAAQVLASAGMVAQDETVHAYMRYAGQGYEVAVALNPRSLSADELRDRFEATYSATYGRIIPDMSLEILSWTLALSSGRQSTAEDTALAVSPSQLDESAEAQTPQPQTPQAIASARVFDGERWLSAPVMLRSELTPHVALSGPMLITEAQTTTYVPSHMQAQVEANGDLILQEV